jgi:hypothetical protein
MPTYTLGDPNNRKYLDATGKGLAPGDTVLYCVAQSSSVSMRFAIIDSFVDLSHPVYLCEKDGNRLETWDRAYKAKVKTLAKKDSLDPYWGVPDDVQYVPNGQGFDRIVTPQTLDDIKTNTITAVQRLVKVDIPVRL